MEVKIGIQHVQRELTIETAETGAKIESRLSAALSTGGVLRLTDEHDRAVLIPASSIAYLDLGAEHARPVGFGVV